MIITINLKSFTLVEVMLVVVVIVTISAIAIPNLLRARLFTQETNAAAALRTIASGETQYRATNSTYATLAQLGVVIPPYIPSNLAATGIKQGYNFAVGVNGGSNFYATAAPQVLTQAHTFYIDEDGLLCRSNATNAAAPTDHTGSGCPAGFSQAQ